MNGFLIAIAALLWASDTPFRLPAVQALDPILIVFLEHGIGLSLMTAWALLRKRKDVFRLRPADWFGAVLVGGGGSALATVLFTASFQYINPSLTILLQKLQPLLVIVLASLLLKEKPRKGFLLWAAIAVLAATVLSFPDLDFSFLDKGIDVHSRGVLYALGAAGLWAVSTVSGKALLRKNSPAAVTFWRYGFGFLTLLGMMTLTHSHFSIGALGSPAVLKAILYIACVPGLLAMTAYYAGLTHTPASTATLIELLYPVSAVALNTVLLHAPLNPVQLAAGGLLLVTILRISWHKGQNNNQS